jgi:uncharacterized membrane protein YczE
MAIAVRPRAFQRILGVPELRGGWREFALRFLVLQVGLMLFGFALVLGYRSGLGLNAWNIFQIALTKYIPITPGQMSIAVGGIMILVAWATGVPPAIATVCNMIFTGLWFDFFAARIPRADHFAVALPMLVAGVVLLGWSSGIYIKAGLGAGPRDSFMLAVVRRTGLNVGVARIVIEGTVFTLGILMDRSQVGIGTLAFTFGIGPMLAWSFRVLRIPPTGKAALPVPVPAVELTAE